jgi:deazaflavin-dependent oxidoreductase (nitroreductase family)
MDAAVRTALGQGGAADITTTGAKTGNPHRIEIGFLSFDGEHYITGQPGRKRDWLANMSANPEFTLHLKRGVQADVPVTADLVTDPDDREAVLRRILEVWDNPPDKIDHIIGKWVAEAPLIRFEVA